MIKKEPKKEPKEEIEIEGIPFIGGLLKGIEKLVDLAEKVEEAGGEIKRKGEIKGMEGREGVRGIYGFSIRTGIGGRPRVQTFGNIKPIKKKFGKPSEKEIKIVETREPIIDVFDEKDHILIVAELPGVAEKTIEFDIRGDILTLRAENEKRKYAKEILLPAKVDSAEKEVSFKNGVLEIKIPKTP